MKSAGNDMNIKEYRYFTDNQWRKGADNQVFEAAVSGNIPSNRHASDRGNRNFVQGERKNRQTKERTITCRLI
jgi:hypothetical protein